MICPYLVNKRCEILNMKLGFFDRYFKCSLACKLYLYEIQRRKANGTVKHHDEHTDSHHDLGDYMDVYHHSDDATNRHQDYLY